MKNIIYMNKDKIYSYLAQYDNGIIESSSKEISHTLKESDAQNGTIFSGSHFSDESTSAQKELFDVLMHDHLCNKFISKIETEDDLVKITPESDLNIDLIQSKAFILIRSKVTFFDIRKIQKVFENFNSVGRAIFELSSMEEISKIKEKIEELKKSNTAQAKKESATLRNILTTGKEELLRSSNLSVDPDVLKNILSIIDFSYTDSPLQAHQIIGNTIIASHLEENYLREKIGILISKYSRKTQSEFIVIGTISKTNSAEDFEENSEIKTTHENSPMLGLMNFVDHLDQLEKKFFSKGFDEITIDPLIIYKPIKI